MRRFGLTAFVVFAAVAFAVPGTTAAASASPAAQAGADPLAQQATQQAELPDPGAAASDEFGFSVAVAGDTALIGAPFGGPNGYGAAYVYTRSGTTWIKQAELSATDEMYDDEFGISVALSPDGDTALVGAPGMTVGTQTGAGVVYVYTRSGTSWSGPDELSDPDPTVTPGFGDSLAFDGGTALIGVRGKWTDPPIDQDFYAGAVYVYSDSGGGWSEQTELPGLPAIANNGCTADSVALSGDTALAGDPGVQVDDLAQEGAAYVYSGAGTSWSGPAELSDPGAAGNDRFGYSVAVDEDTALIGAPGEAIDGMGGAGAVFIYNGAGTSWSQQTEMKDPDPAISDGFGCTVALSGDTALVGAPNKTVNGVVGVVYVYARSGTSWSQQAELNPPDASGDAIGDSTALSGLTALIGAYGESVGGQSNAGVAYVEVLPSSDDTLSNLTVSAGSLSPSFNPDTLSYNDSVANNVNDITVIPTTNDPNATCVLKEGDSPVTNPIALNVGDNAIDVVVTAQDGITSQTYALTVTRAKSSDDRLTSLTVSAGTLTPEFAPDTLNYSDEVANDVSHITVSGTFEDSNANGQIEVGGNPVSNPIPLQVGANVIALVVTAQDGITTQTYVVTVTRAKSSDDTLKSLAVSDGELSPSFSPDTLAYSDRVAHSVSSISVTATTNDADASYALEVGGEWDTNSITLSEDETVIDIVVTAQDGTTSQTYSVTVGRLSNDDTLQELTVSAGELSPVFAADILDYADEVSNKVTSITVTATPHDENATCALEADGEPVINPFFLVVGANVIDVVVTAQDGITSQTYAVTVTRAPLVPKLTLKLSGLIRGALTLGKRLTAKGKATPASLAGGKVKLTVQRKQGGTWRKVRSLTATIGAKGTFSATYQPAQKGTYRIQATIAETAAHVAAETRWLTFKVK